MNWVQSFRSLLTRKPAPKRPAGPRNSAGFRYRPSVEGLETRLALSAAPSLLPVSLGSALVGNGHGHGHNQHQAQSVLPMTITGVTAQGGQLVAQGLIGVNPFTAPITLETPSAAAPTGAAAPLATTSILHLRINAIHLNLLGLKVDTSNICLDITAQSGPGNLLGNLLTNIANLLNNGTSLGDILGGLTATQTSTLTNGLTGLLNGVFSRLTSPSAVTPSATSILHLALGPVDLNLLGLDVHLDNCANGPVTVDVSAQPGPGNLLGNLLSAVAGLLDNPRVLTRLVDRILMLI